MDASGKVDEIERRDALEIVRVDHERLACTLVHAIDTDGAHVLIALKVADSDSVGHARRVAESIREGALRVACASNQMHSDALSALRRTQTHSDAFSALRRHVAIKDHQQPSELIRAHQAHRGSSTGLIRASSGLIRSHCGHVHLSAHYGAHPAGFWHAGRRALDSVRPAVTTRTLNQCMQ